MKSIFFLFICIGILFAKYDFTNLDNEVKNTEISVESLDKRNIKKVNVQKKELVELKEKLEKIKKKLNKQDTLDNLKLNTFTINLEAAYDTKNKSKDTSSYFRQGDILEFTSSIKYPELDEETTTILQWQLFDENGNPIENYFKENRFQFINTSKTHNFKIKLGQNLKSGKYKVALTHFLKHNIKISQQTIKSFELKQDIQFTNLSLFTNPKDTKDREFFYHNQTPHLYAYFKLAPRIKKVNVFFNAVNQKGEILYKYKGTRKRKGDTQRSGIKISDLKAGDSITFNALLTDDDGYEVRKSKNFKVSYYNLGIIGDFTNLKHNEIRSFKLRVPKIFKKPFKIVNLNKGNAYKINFNNSTLQGKIKVTNFDKKERFDFIEVMVIDNKGRKAANVHSIKIKAKPQVLIVKETLQSNKKKQKSKGKKYLDSICGIDTSKYSKWNGWEHSRGYSLKTKNRTYKQHQYKHFTKQCLLYESHIINTLGIKIVTYWNKPPSFPSKHWKTGAKNMMFKYDLSLPSKKELEHKEWNTIGVLKFHRKNGKVIFDK